MTETRRNQSPLGLILFLICLLGFAAFGAAAQLHAVLPLLNPPCRTGPLILGVLLLSAGLGLAGKQNPLNVTLAFTLFALPLSRDFGFFDLINLWTIRIRGHDTFVMELFFAVLFLSLGSCFVCRFPTGLRTTLSQMLFLLCGSYELAVFFYNAFSRNKWIFFFVGEPIV